MTIDEIDRDKVKCKMQASWARKAPTIWLVPGALTRDIESMKDWTTTLELWHKIRIAVPIGYGGKTGLGHSFFRGVWSHS